MDYKDIELKNETMKPHIKNTLTALEDALMQGRDDEKIPIYLTKWRIKSSQSIYLKHKRKPNSPIDDRGGMRVLCLFEQDILPSFEFIIRKINELGYALKEVVIYNWESEEDLLFFEQITLHEFKKSADFKSEFKKSGYKSVHFIVTSTINKKEYPIEIQLRTLLQDVWGELEHSLAYKQGNIHPHIKKSFSLLANDLQTSDKLIAHLRDISDRERNIAEFTFEDKKPIAVFAYEDDLVPDLFKDEVQKSLLANYDEHIAKHWNDNDTLWISEARSLYEKIEAAFEPKGRREPKVKYWLDSEDAFLLFANRQYDTALKKYEDIITNNKDRYVPQFRIGEIQLYKSNVEKSLTAFDKCEELLKAETGSNVEADKFNVYLVKSILANVYWRLGEEYVHLAVQEIREAEAIYIENIDHFREFLTPKRKAALVNNICYYLLENYILAARRLTDLSGSEEKEKVEKATHNCEETFSELEKRFAQLETMIKTTNFNSANAFDTASWFCYHAHLKFGSDNDWLDKAYNYCKEAWKKESAEGGGDLINSVNVRRMHTQEIRTAKYAKKFHF